MKQVLSRLHQRFDQRISIWLEHEALTGSVRCGKGCSACCDVPMLTSLAEAILLRERVPAQLDPVIHRRHQTVCELWQSCEGDEDLWARTYRFCIGSCLFLAPDGSCSVHEVRPLPCRQTLSINPPLLCRRDLERRMSSRQRLQWVCRLTEPRHRGRPYLYLPLRYGQYLESIIQREMLHRWGVGLWGNLWSLLDLLGELPRERGDGDWIRALHERIQSGLPPTLLIRRECSGSPDP